MITVFSLKQSNRFNYAVDLVFKQILNLDYQIVNNDELLDNVSINYSDKKIPGVYQVKPIDLLFTDYLIQDDIPHQFNELDILRFFPTEDDHGFDVFSACFYLVSRMEEYLDNRKDTHDRFSAKQSVLYKLKVLEKPIVNIWCKNLLKKLNEFYNSKVVSNTEFNQLNTIDVDNAYAYLHKGVLRTSAALIKSALKLNYKEFIQRIRVLGNKEKDPYDTYDYLLEYQKKNKLSTYFFLLLGDYRKNDKNLSYKSKALHRLILRIKNEANIGIHPSYFSFLNPDQMNKEVNRLKDIINENVVNSRNHYLRFSIPQTYQSLIELGIKKDFTMGYQDALGFRAGICSPFYFYDLNADRVTELQIIPFAYMEGVLRDYMNLNIENAIDKIKVLKNEVKDVNGCFVGIWHNESLSDQARWKGWRKVYESSFSSS